MEHVLGNRSAISAISRFLQFVAAFTSLAAGPAFASQNTDAAPADPLQQHYNAAQDAQSAGDLSKASAEYKLFLGQALHRLADHRASAGDFRKAVSFFDEATPLTPDDANLLLDYVEACRALPDLPKAEMAVEKALALEPINAKAHFALGRVLLQMNDAGTAKQYLETSVQLDPTFEHGYTLAIAYLKLKDPDRAATIFGEMQKGFGDTAVIHMEFGRAFAQAGYPERGIPEFSKAIAIDDKLAGAHYSLGAAYLVGLADAAFPDAAVEFRKELANHPDDVLSLYQLGYIDLNQHKLTEAEGHLTRAASLDPKNPDIFLSLGQVYAEQERQREAETALRKSIQFTTDVSRNHYQVQRAHYLLGRLLVQTGHPSDAREELKLSDQLLKASVVSNQGGARVGIADDERKRELFNKTPPELDPAAVKQAEAYEDRVRPAIADAYNNMGVIAAGQNAFVEATGYFQRAAAWDPSLEDLDLNWGRAAFSARLFGPAVAPLTRYLESHPDDTRVRSALGVSLFNVERYKESVDILRPLQNHIDSDARLNYIYAVSLVKGGETDAGLRRLQKLAEQIPNLADVHASLGEAYAARGDHVQAAEELRKAIELNPADMRARLNLAHSLIALKKNAEVRAVLTEASIHVSGDAGLYYELGKLQLENEDINGAIANLETGSRIDPDNDSIHYELAEAYRRSARAEDAGREMKLYEEIQKRKPDANRASKPN